MSAPHGMLLILVTLATSLPGAEPAHKFAVVELFTSEGCSSCPPADRVLMDLSRPREDGADIYCLSFHVDYWNRLGWTDPFSSNLVTRRQSAYGRHFDLDAIYTPQMVVNGTVQFVGSRRETAIKAVECALETPPENSLTITPRLDEGGEKIEIAYRAQATAPHLMVLIALVQNEGTNDVTRGENAGKTLAHVGIVRSFRTALLGSQATGIIELTRPAALQDENLEIVGIVQDTQSAKIVAADRCRLP